jgi:hypothetical protein
LSSARPTESCGHQPSSRAHPKVFCITNSEKSSNWYPHEQPPGLQTLHNSSVATATDVHLAS